MIQPIRQLYKNAYTGLDRRMWLLSLVMFVNRSGTMVLAFMTLYCVHLGFSMKAGGMVVAIYGLGSILGAWLGGRISDRIGFYTTQLLTLFVGGLMFIVLGQMRSYTGICIAAFFLSMVNEAFRPANASAIAHYSNAQNRTQAFSLVRLAINLGWGVGSALGGLLASINYHLLFWVDGCTNIVAAGLLWWLLPKVSLQQQQHVPATSAPMIGKSSPMQDRTFLYFVGLIVLFATCFFQLFTSIPLFFRQVLQLTEWEIGVTMAFNGILIALVEMVIVFSLEGRKPYLAWIMRGTGLMAVSFFMLNITLMHGFLLALVFTLSITVAEMVAMPFMNSYYISRSNQQNRGKYAAIYTMAWSIAQVLGSSSGTQIAERWGFSSLWWLVGGTSVLAMIGFARLGRRGTREFQQTA